jgi:(p)ppGpp synthase/HD superfamily hydrolase
MARVSQAPCYEKTLHSNKGVSICYTALLLAPAPAPSDFSLMSLLEKAIVLAVHAHQGQKDRAGQPYIMHPLRLLCRVQSDLEKITAVLHDVVEDTPITLEQLRSEGFPGPVIEAVDCLTKREGEPYDHLIERAAANPIARRVKMADLEDNMDIRRNGSLQEKDLERLERYRRAWLRLTSS